MPWYVWFSLGMLIGALLGVLGFLLLLGASEIDQDHDQGSLIP